MLRVTAKTLIGKYAQFLLENRGKFAGLTFAGRTRKISSLYRSLSTTALEELAKRAAKTKRPTIKRNKVTKQGPNVYAQFVKANLRKVSGRTQQEKIRRVAALWRKQK